MRGRELGRDKDLILISRITDVSKGAKVKVISDMVRLMGKLPQQLCKGEKGGRLPIK